MAKLYLVNDEVIPTQKERMAIGADPGPFFGRVEVAVVLFGVEGIKPVIGLRHQRAGSTIAFGFPTKYLQDGQDPEKAASQFASELVMNEVVSIALLGVHRGRTASDEPSLLIGYVGVCKERPARERDSELEFAMLKPLRRGHAEFLRPHDQVLRNSLEWLFGAVQELPLVGDMCGPRFTITELREVYEDIWGLRKLDPANFYKQVTKPGLGFVKKIQEFAGEGPGKPAALYARGEADVLSSPVRPPNKKEAPSVRVWGRDEEGRLR